MSDGREDGGRRSFINVLVNSTRWTIFIKLMDSSCIYHDSENLFELLDSLVEEIGEEDFVQVVTDLQYKKTNE